MASTHDTDASQQCRKNALKVNLVIHQQFPGIELVSPLYYSDGAICYLPPDQRVDVGSTTQVGFNIDLAWYRSTGTLMYRLRKKNTDQSNEDAISSEDEVKHIQFVLTWVAYRFEIPYIYLRLIEHDKNRVWDRIGLMKLAGGYKEYYYSQRYPEERTYLMRDNTMLMTRVDMTRERACYKIEMTISKTDKYYFSEKTEYIDVDR
jgi:hypothetical protein